MIQTIIFDWKRTIYDPDNSKLIDGAKQILEFLKKHHIKLILIGKGGDDMQGEVNRLGVKKYFSEIVFAEGDKDPNVFKKYIWGDPEHTLVIGDRVRSELEIGKSLGAVTVWVKQGKFASEEPLNKNQQPDFVAPTLEECLQIISSSLD